MTMYPDKISNEEVNQLPMLEFEGKIVIISDPSKVAACMSEIMEMEFVGFDTESKPNFVKGIINPISLIQISLKNKVFIFRILATGITDEMKVFFESEIKKVGIALRDDIKGLRRDREFKPQGFIDLGEITETLGIHNKGLRKLAAIILEKRISKSQQLSNWENEVLTPSQVQYAAVDAWACWKMYDALIEKGYISFN